MDNTEQTPAPQPAKGDFKRTAKMVVAIIIVAAFAWAFGSKFFAVRAAERAGIIDGAAALASAAAPLLDMNSKGALADAETLQRVVDDAVASKRFRFAAILDSSGRVLAASDRSVGKSTNYKGFKPNEMVEGSQNGAFEVIYPVKHGSVTYGAVVLRAP